MSADVVQVAQQTHWLWWGAGAVVGAMMAFGIMWGYGAQRFAEGKLSVKTSRSRAAKAGHETRKVKRGNENVFVRPIVENDPRRAISFRVDDATPQG